MRIFEEAFPVEIHSGLLPDDNSQVVFFDIETTGFSSQSAFVYLIGCIYYKEKTWRIRQWFLDDFNNEKELLSSFFDFIRSFRWLIHFNGTAFDIPFLEKRLERCRLAESFSVFQSLDLYKELKPYKKIFGLSGMKQKQLEEFLGISRDDPFTGGELIEVYYEYMDARKEELLSCLLLHNADDLRGMLSILPLYGLTLLFNGMFSIDTRRQTEDSISFYLRSELPLPSSLSLDFGKCALSIEHKTICASVPLIRENLKYFYPNYKDYYYLLQEDQAVHKSVAVYVDKAYRRAATAKNCYTRRESVFLPLADKDFTQPVFQREYKKKEYFIELTEEFLHNKELQKKYLVQLFADKNLVCR